MSDFALDAERSRRAKVALRSQMLAARRSLTGSARRAADASIQSSTLACIQDRQPTRCAAYAPINLEPGGPDLPDLLASITLPSHPVPPHPAPAVPSPEPLPTQPPAPLPVVPLPTPLPVLPVLLPVLLPDGDLDWALHQDPLLPASRGLQEPTGPRLGPDAITQADLILVPALAVDRRTGIRMGRGGGSYDRALSRLTRSFVVALLYDGELVEDLPHEPHDHPVDAVITPTEGLVIVGDRH